MPFGYSTTRYLALLTTCLFSGLAGSQVVHMMYKPLDGFDELIEARLQELEPHFIPPSNLEEMINRYEGYERQLADVEKRILAESDRTSE